MTNGTTTGAALATTLVVVALAAGCRGQERDAGPAAASSGASPSTTAGPEGLLFGRVTLDDGTVYEGRLRFGGDEEALWGNYFNGAKDENPWLALVPPDERPRERPAIEIFGVELSPFERELDVGRPFMARFGDIARIDARGADLRVTLKSGTAFHLDRFGADDLADGVQVWDAERGVVDLGEWRIRTIELLAPARPGDGPAPLHGTVHTRDADFTGFVQWDREQAVDSDELHGHGADGPLAHRFDAIRSIVREDEGARVTLLDGHELVLTGTREVGDGNRGVYVDDLRYGRVLVSWEAFERVDFSPGGGGPAYGDFPPGGPLTGSVTTRSGRRLVGRLVYDLDESETTETLDAPWQGVDYTIPFGMVASIALADPDRRGDQPARVTLHAGEELRLEHDGDLGEGNAGLLVFTDDARPPEYVRWTDVSRLDFDRPAASYPPVGLR